LYEPNGYFYGTDVFSYKVSDGPAVSELAAEVNVVITPVDYYTVIGFQDPWRPPQPIYSIKAGSGVPLKWQYSDGAEIVNSGSWNPLPQIWIHKSVDCGVPSPDDPDFETDKFINDTGSSDYRYFSDTDTWQFNWDTAGTTKGECYNIYVYTPHVNELSQAYQIKFK
jgi:hypothetical protein